MIIGHYHGLPVIDKNTELDMVKDMDKRAVNNPAYSWGSWKQSFQAAWLRKRGLPDKVISINGIKYGKVD